MNPQNTTNIINLFATPVGVFPLPQSAELNPGLKAAILQHERDQEAKVVTNNVGGWHSGFDLLEWPVPEINNLKDWIITTVHYMIGTVTRQEKFKVSLALYAWANINRPHCYREGHTHPNAHWSGVYYVQAGDYSEHADPLAGQIAFDDPRGLINMFPHPGKTDYGSSFPIKPTEGTLLVFPAWLQHGVRSFNAGPDRISISFNARVTDYEPQKTDS